jgi:PAS domain S-box-containing protein
MNNKNLKPSVLYVDDEKANLTSFKYQFRDFYDIHLADSADKALKILAETDIPVVISDQRMPGITGVELLEKVNISHPETIRMIMTGYSDMAAVVDGINKGKIYYYLTKPWDEVELKLVIERALEIVGLRKDNIKIQEELKQNEQLFRDLLESAPDSMIITKESGEIILVNSQTEKLFGYGRDELISKKVEILIPNRYQSHEQHVESYAANPQVRSMGANRDLMARKKDGSEFPVDISLSPLQTAQGTFLLAATRDISTRMEHEKAIKNLNEELEDRVEQRTLELKESEKRFRNIVEYANDLIFTLDKDYVFTLVSPVSVGILGLEPSQVIGSHLKDIVFPEDYSRCIASLENNRQTLETLELDDFRVMHKDGTLRWLRITGSAVVDSNGNYLHFVGTAQDVSERKKTQDKLHQYTTELEDFNKVMLGREERIIELKEEVNKLAVKLSIELPYDELWKLDSKEK